MNQLHEAVERVRRLRAVRDEAKEKVRVQRDAFEETIANDVKLAKEWDAEVATAEHAAKTLALAAYQADPTNKKPCDGVSVKEMRVLTYDGLQALAWAKEKQMCLIPESLDTKALEAIAKTMTLPFVTVTIETTAQLAKDLPELATTTEAPY